MIKDWSSEYVLPAHEGPDFFFHLAPFDIMTQEDCNTSVEAHPLFTLHLVCIKLSNLYLFFKS